MGKTGVKLNVRLRPPSPEGGFILLCVIVYADDIVLIASSPFGLKLLIEATFSFACRFNDITFNASKSWILGLGPHNKPPVSILGIPTTEKHEYLGVEIGRKADPQSQAAAKLLPMRSYQLLISCRKSCP